MNLDDLLARLTALADPATVAQKAEHGINSHNTLGISIYTLRPLAKEIGIDHDLACQLWASGIHEARILAGYIADPALVTGELMDAWAADFDSWDVCDQVTTGLFDQTALAYSKAAEWAGRPEEFVKRAGFALMAGLAVHDKAAPDAKLAQFFPLIVREAGDERNFVKKAVNWALRNLGKRNLALNQQAIAAAGEIQALGTRPARWIAADALRELTGDKVQARLKKRAEVGDE